jgi:hypothetical protein
MKTHLTTTSDTQAIASENGYAILGQRFAGAPR